MEEQQQQQGTVHQRVLEGIERLSDPRENNRYQHLLQVDFEYLYGSPTIAIDRHSWQYLVDFLDNDDSHQVTELKLIRLQLVSDPSDGGLNVLRTFFARSDTTLTRVVLRNCEFGDTDETLELLEAFQTNRTVTDLEICDIRNLNDGHHGDELGACLSGLMQNMPQLRKLVCRDFFMNSDEIIHALQPGLRNNQTLKQLILSGCAFSDQGITFLANALVGNTTMEALDISQNLITSLGLPYVMRLIESTRIKSINLEQNDDVFENELCNQQFAAKLHANTTVQELHADWVYEREELGELEESVNVICARNKSMAHVALLLAPPPPPPRQQQQPMRPGTSTMTLLLKTWHKAITKFAIAGPRGGNAGASAIFELLQARPAILEKRLKRPAPAAAAAQLSEQEASQGNGNNNGNCNSAAFVICSSGKRRRL